MIRLVEDYLREEYIILSPLLNKIKINLEIDINKQILPIVNKLQSFERVSVVSRIKTMKSAIEKLQSKQEGKTFQQNYPEKYSLKQLKDLVGLRVLYFPETLKEELHCIIINKYKSWKYEPVMDFEKGKDIIIHKFYGSIEIGPNIISEIQIMPMLYSRFLDLEHDIIYKPDPKYKGIQRSFELKEVKNKVLKQFQQFENVFCELLNQYEKNTNSKEKQ